MINTKHRDIETKNPDQAYLQDITHISMASLSISYECTHG